MQHQSDENSVLRLSYSRRKRSSTESRFHVDARQYRYSKTRYVEFASFALCRSHLLSPLRLPYYGTTSRSTTVPSWYRYLSHSQNTISSPQWTARSEKPGYERGIPGPKDHGEPAAFLESFSYSRRAASILASLLPRQESAEDRWHKRYFG